MINPSLQSQNISPFCSTNYNKSATIQRHHPHHHQSKAATRRRIRTSAVGARSRSHKHEHQRSFQYTRTLGVILEEQQHDSATSQHCGDNTNTVITTDFWHSMRGMKKSATSVSLDSLVANEEEIMNNEENQSPNQVHNGPVSIEFEQDENDFDNFLEDWDL